MQVILWAALGLCAGSFANVVAYRLPRNISVVSPPSACRACKGPIAFYDLLPVVSWLALRGRCRSCGVAISPGYPIGEISCMIIFAGMMLFAPVLSAVVLSLYGFILLVITLVDWEYQVIPDGLLIIAGVIGAGWVVAGHFSPHITHAPGFYSAGLGILAGAAPLLVIDKLVQLFARKDGFGYGDVKLMAVAGLYLGASQVFAAFFFAFVTGGMYAAFLLVTGRARRGEYIAFGPFLCGGIIVALWAGNLFWNLFT